MELSCNENKVYSAINRFYTKFKLRRSNNPNPHKLILDNLNKISILKIYYKKCVYSNDKNIIKDNIVIIFKLNEVYCLNLLFDDYKDILLS
jgi:hypothetical protein